MNFRMIVLQQMTTVWFLKNMGGITMKKRIKRSGRKRPEKETEERDGGKRRQEEAAGKGKPEREGGY